MGRKIFEGSKRLEILDGEGEARKENNRLRTSVASFASCNAISLDWS